VVAQRYIAAAALLPLFNKGKLSTILNRLSSSTTPTPTTQLYATVPVEDDAYETAAEEQQQAQVAQQQQAGTAQPVAQAPEAAAAAAAPAAKPAADDDDVSNAAWGGVPCSSSPPARSCLLSCTRVAMDIRAACKTPM